MILTLDTVSFTGAGSNTNANKCYFYEKISFLLEQLLFPQQFPTIDGTTQVGAMPANGVNTGCISYWVREKHFISSIVIQSQLRMLYLMVQALLIGTRTVNPSQSPVTKTFLQISFPLKLTMQIL